MALAAPSLVRAQPRATVPARPPTDLREVRLVHRDAPRRPSHTPPRTPPLLAPRARSLVILMDPAGAAPAPAAAPAPPPAVPRTLVIEVGASAAPSDTTCGGARDARALLECLTAAVRREDARLAAAHLAAREPLARTRPAASVAAFDAGAAAWARYRARECRARSLAVGGEGDAPFQRLTCQLRLARERRALLEAAGGATPTGS